LKLQNMDMEAFLESFLRLASHQIDKK